MIPSPVQWVKGFRALPKLWLRFSSWPWELLYAVGVAIKKKKKERKKERKRWEWEETRTDFQI